MFVNVKKIILAMNNRRGNFRRETKNIKKNIQMKITEYKHTTKINWKDLD